MMNSSTLHSPRHHDLLQWLQSLQDKHPLDLDSLKVASADASFRQYYRLQADDTQVIVMDAPPPQEDCRPFVEIAQLLQRQGIKVPTILAQNMAQGFLLLSDLGQYNYFQLIQRGIDDGQLQQMYRAALDCLVLMQQTQAQHLPAYDVQRLRQELELFEEWYVRGFCQDQLSEQEQEHLYPVLDQLVAENAQEAQVFVHRDFHSPNLMWCETSQDPAAPNPGVIDFQDALYGPLSYDLASLVMDARTTWEEPQQLDWAIRYWEKARAAQLPIPDDFAIFHRQYELMSLQRNLRILGVFARLALRDGKAHYLPHLPRVRQYIRQVAQRYQAYRPIVRLLDRLEGVQPQTHYTF